MATEGFKRKFTTILSADVVGYSRLIGEDEAKTVRTLDTYRRVISDLIHFVVASRDKAVEAGERAVRLNPNSF